MDKMGQLRLYFSDFFNVDEDLIESYRVVNISLNNDMPLFIDPFLLFNSNNEVYQAIHKEIINYLLKYISLLICKMGVSS